MRSFSDESGEQVLTALRRVIRAVDLHSRHLTRSHGLTTPQVLVLKALLSEEPLTAGVLARRINLSQATVTDILNRLAKRGLVVRTRSDVDRRRVCVEATQQARELLQGSPPLLQVRFLEEYKSLADWEKNMLLSSLQRIAAMMDSDHIVTVPALSNDFMAVAPEGSKMPENMDMTKSQSAAKVDDDASPAATEGRI